MGTQWEPNVAPRVVLIGVPLCLLSPSFPPPLTFRARSSLQEFKLAQHMKEPPVVDTSSMLLSPMPGKLISYAVEVGDEVELGQALCVVEAMKMQNVMRSERKGVVKTINSAVGDSLKVDQVMLEFEE